MNTSLQIRKAEIDDINQIRMLFFETINHVNKEDYNAFQLEIWSSGYQDLSSWEKKLSEQYFIVAKIKTLVVGFASLAVDGCVDCMYVHKNHQREGVATKLLGALEKQAIASGLIEIRADVSITAKPFFLRKGFAISKVYLKEFKGVYFENTIMKKTYSVKM